MCVCVWFRSERISPWSAGADYPSPTATPLSSAALLQWASLFCSRAHPVCMILEWELVWSGYNIRWEKEMAFILAESTTRAPVWLFAIKINMVMSGWITFASNKFFQSEIYQWLLRYCLKWSFGKMSLRTTVVLNWSILK